MMRNCERGKMKIYIHIGAGKCASSSIQTHFSKYHTQEKLVYGNIIQNGDVLLGEQLLKQNLDLNKNNQTPYYYLPIPFLERVLKVNSKTDKNLFFSHEVWHLTYEYFMNLKDLLKQYHVEVIFIIRPPVQWCNSAWWQWYNWDLNIKSFDNWLEQTLFTGEECELSWFKFYNNFKQLSYVKKIHLLSLQPNIIEQVYGIMDIPYKHTQEIKSNVSSSKELLYFLSSHKHLRPVHGIELEETLNTHLKKRSPTPWALSRDNVEKILDMTKDSCLALAPHIANENILENPLWWDVSAYEDKIASYSTELKLSEETLSDMLEEAYVTIGKLDKKVRDTEANILKNEINNIKIKANYEAELSNKNLQIENISNSLILCKPYISFIYFCYRIASEITFGKTKNRYKMKKQELKSILREMQRIA